MEASETEGRSFMQAICEKYSPENFPCRRGPGLGVVVVPSVHQGSPMKDRLNLPSVLVLNGCGISHAGEEGEIAAFCTHVVELDLSHNKLQDWHEEKQLQDVPAKYSIEVKGSACVSLQMSLFYNIPTPKDSKALQIFARTEGLCQSGKEQILDVVLDIIYTGTQDSSNMVIVDMKLLSGFKLEPSSLDVLKKAVHRVESKDDHVIMYLQEVQKYMHIRPALRIRQIFSVKNLKPAVVKVYDYYQTSKSKLLSTIAKIRSKVLQACEQ